MGVGVEPTTSGSSFYCFIHFATSTCVALCFLMLYVAGKNQQKSLHAGGLEPPTFSFVISHTTRPREHPSLRSPGARPRHRKISCDSSSCSPARDLSFSPLPFFSSSSQKATNREKLQNRVFHRFFAVFRAQVIDFLESRSRPTHYR